MTDCKAVSPDESMRRRQEGAHANFNDVDAADVYAAYRLFLGRHPEGGVDQVHRHLDTVRDLTALRRRFATAPEFRSIWLEWNIEAPASISNAPSPDAASPLRTLLANAVAVGTLIPWTDPASGIRSYLLRRLAAPLQQSFYFTQPCWTRDGRFLWIYCTYPPSGSARDGRLLAVVDFVAGTVTCYPETGFNDASPWVDIDDGTVAWTTRDSVWTRGPAPEDKARRLTRIPDEILRRRPVWRLATHLSRSVDKTWFLIDATIGHDRILGGIPAGGGDLEIWQKFKRQWHHAQFSPTDPDLILLAEEEIINPRTGIVTPAAGRIALTSRKGPLRCLDLGNAVGHEWWDMSGEAIWYVDFERGVMRVKITGGGPECVWPAGNWHANASRCGNYLVADTLPRVTGGRVWWSVLFFNRKTGRAVAIVSQMPAGSLDLEPYHVHPHPSFQCDDQVIIYTSQAAGGTDVAAVLVEDLIAKTQ